MSDLTAGDVLAMTRNNEGFLEGNGIIILILFFLMFSGGGMWGNSGNFTRAEMQDGFNNQNLVNSLNNMSMNMNNGFNGITQGMNNGFNSVNANLAGMSSQIQQNCCDIKTAINFQGDLTRQTITGLMQEQQTQELRDKLADKDRELNSAIFAASQMTQTRTLEDFILANK